MAEKKGCLELKQEVMDTEECTRCGLCAGFCPYIKAVYERVALVHPCGLEEGNCYRVCPRTTTDWEAIDREVFSRAREDHVLGNYTDIVYARARQRDLAQKGQYGGVVSALADYLLAKGTASGVVMAGGAAGELPYPTVAKNREEVLNCAGSRYSALPTLSLLHEHMKYDNSPAVIGRPCQVLAVRKLQSVNDKKPGLVIGLFCFWSLETGFYDFIQSKANGQKILKVDIPQEGLTVHTENGVILIPIDEIRRFIRKTCNYCFDPTSEFADVSVGSTEFDPEWNTLIIRTPKGKEVVEAAIAEGVIEVKPYPPERLPLLLRAVKNKKTRVLDAKETGQGAGYLSLSQAYLDGLGKERG